MFKNKVKGNKTRFDTKVNEKKEHAKGDKRSFSGPDQCRNGGVLGTSYLINDKDYYSSNDLTINFIFCPGLTPGSCCLYPNQSN